MKVKIVKEILWFLLGIGTVVGASRFIFGLGATTNMTDTTPWGVWIGLKMGLVAFSASGFVIAGFVYIFHIKQYRPILRAAVLAAFLGYVSFATSLFFDLGLPWNIWYPIIFWNPHSPLFEVSWCVMLYLTVLLLEFLPVPLEKSSFKKILSVLKKSTIILVILGIMLSALHQSSLGSLLLIMRLTIHPLWYSQITPILFLISAIGLGLMAVTLISIVISWLYNRKYEVSLLSGLGKAASWVLAFYAVLYLAALSFEGNIGLLFESSWESYLFIFELLISAVIPAALLAIPKVRNSLKGLTICSSMVLTCIMLNRLNASGIALIRATGTDYVPSVMEIMITLWIASLAVLIFLFLIENFKVYEKEIGVKVSLRSQPVFNIPFFSWLDKTIYESIKRNAASFIIGFAVTFVFLPIEAREGPQPLSIPVERARLGKVHLIDGNRTNMAVLFDHEKHKKKNGGGESCKLCHHMRKPLDEYTPCAECHADMQLETDIFNRKLHLEKLNGFKNCKKCHTDSMNPKTIESVTKCKTCHSDMRITDTIIKVSVTTHENKAVNYKEAMHGLCITCHELKKTELNKPRMAECITCHGRVRLPEVSSAIIPPDRSKIIIFSHSLHFFSLELDCDICHEKALESTLSSDNLLPVMDICMNCHDGENASKECKTCHLNPDNTIAFINPERELTFNHQHHLESENLECTHCHKEFDTVDLSFETPNAYPEMRMCMVCHDGERANNQCEQCHTHVETLLPLSHTPGWKILHGLSVQSDDVSCQKCHEKEYSQE